LVNPTQPCFLSIRTLRGPKGHRGIPGFHGQRGNRGKRGFKSEKGEKGADSRCEICCWDSTPEFHLEDAEHDQEDERQTPQALGETESSLEGANKASFEQDMKSKI
jgi:hypothetical protein